MLEVTEQRERFFFQPFFYTYWEVNINIFPCQFRNQETLLFL